MLKNALEAFRKHPIRFLFSAAILIIGAILTPIVYAFRMADQMAQELDDYLSQH